MNKSKLTKLANVDIKGLEALCSEEDAAKINEVFNNPAFQHMIGHTTIIIQAKAWLKGFRWGVLYGVLLALIVVWLAVM